MILRDKKNKNTNKFVADPLAKEPIGVAPSSGQIPVQVKVADSEFIGIMAESDLNSNASPKAFVSLTRVCRVMFMPTQGTATEPPSVAMSVRSIGAIGYMSDIKINPDQIIFVMELDQTKPMYKTYIEQTTNLVLP